MSNTLIITEAVLLQDLITTIWRKSKHMNYRSIVALTDNRKLARQINNKMEKSNWLAQDAGVEIAAIKDIIEKVTIRIVV